MSFDFPSMSLEALQQTATRPYRFESAALKSTLANPVSLSTCLNMVNRRSHMFKTAKIIPGGQYLVTAGRTGWAEDDESYDNHKPKAVVSVWDLQASPAGTVSKVAEFEPTAQESGNEILRSVQSVSVRLDEKGGGTAAMILVRCIDGGLLYVESMSNVTTRP